MTDDAHPSPDHDTVDVPTTCETCGTTLETGMVGVSDADVGDTPDLPATTVHEVFCPNPDCPAHKPEAHEPEARGAAAAAPGAEPGDADAHDAPGSMGGANGGA